MGKYITSNSQFVFMKNLKNDVTEQSIMNALNEHKFYVEKVKLEAPTTFTDNDQATKWASIKLKNEAIGDRLVNELSKGYADIGLNYPSIQKLFKEKSAYVHFLQHNRIMNVRKKKQEISKNSEFNNNFSQFPGPQFMMPMFPPLPMVAFPGPSFPPQGFQMPRNNFNDQIIPRNNYPNTNNNDRPQNYHDNNRKPGGMGGGQRNNNRDQNYNSTGRRPNNNNFGNNNNNNNQYNKDTRGHRENTGRYPGPRNPNMGS